MRKDGLHSLDALRKKEKHKHHGLNITGDCEKLHSKKKIPDFFSSLQCKIHVKDRTRITKEVLEELEKKKINTDKLKKLTENVEFTKQHLTNELNNQKIPQEQIKLILSHVQYNMPWGQFSLFYNSLIPPINYIPYTYSDTNNPDYISTADDIFNYPAPVELTKLISQNIKTLDLIKTLPELYLILQEFDIDSLLCPGSAHGYVINNFNKSIENSFKNKNYIDYFIKVKNQSKKNIIIEAIKKTNSAIEFKNYLNSQIHMRLDVNYGNDNYELIEPDIIQDMYGNFFYLLHPESYITEPAAHFILLYCLGMLVRYYPDIWVKTINTNTQVLEITNLLLKVIHKKFPNLILEQLNL